MSYLSKILSMLLTFTVFVSLNIAEAKKTVNIPHDPNLMRKLDVKSSDTGGGTSGSQGK